MWTEIWCNFVNNSGTIGTFVPLAGFTITIVTIFKIKKAANIAKNASEETIRKLSYIDIDKELSASIEIADEIKTLIGLKAWHLLPDRLSFFTKESNKNYTY